MKFYWTDYNPAEMNFVEKWLDRKSVKSTGLDDGLASFYEYWKNEKDTILNQNFWCKVVSENNIPFGVIALGFHENSFTVMEMLIAPKMRNKGKGTLLIKDLIENGKDVLGIEFQKAEAVIYPSNPASQRCFEKAGFVFDHAHEDGDALYYTFKK